MIKSSQNDADESDSAKMAENIEERKVSEKETKTTTFLTDLPQEMSSSQRTVTSVRRVVDDLGNVVSEEIETRTLEGDEDDFAQETFSNLSENLQVVSTQRKVTSIKKTVDEFGNVISEQVQTSNLPTEEVTTAPNLQMISSERKVTSTKRVLDEYGNVVSEEKVTRTLDGNTAFDDVTTKMFGGVPSNVQVVSSERKVTSVKKVMDEFGNVITEDVQTTTLPSEETSSGFSAVTPGKHCQYSGSLTFCVLRARVLTVLSRCYCGKTT